MPKKIDPKIKERCVRQVLDGLAGYWTLTAAAEAVARREGVGKESVLRWVRQAQIDGGQRQGVSSEALAEICELEGQGWPGWRRTTRSCGEPRFSSRGKSTPQPLIVAFVDEMRAEGSSATQPSRDECASWPGRSMSTAAVGSPRKATMGAT